MCQIIKSLGEIFLYKNVHTEGHWTFGCTAELPGSYCVYTAKSKYKFLYCNCGSPLIYPVTNTLKTE